MRPQSIRIKLQTHSLGKSNMAGLTVAEKKDWKERLSKRIDRPIEVITAEDPQLLDRVRGEARQRALESLGLADNQRELDDIRKQREKLDEREEELKNQLLARVKGVHPNEVGSTYGCDTEVNKAIRPRVEAHEEQLLKDSDVGRRIVELRREKDNLLDTVWLATSSAQIKELWGKVATLLRDEPTPLGRDALAIAPVTD